MTLATVSATGQPSARVVLLKGLSAEHGYAVFYTHYGSRKGKELDTNAHAAAVLHWDNVGRQIRLEGLTLKSPTAESDAYFASRPWRSQLNAWASAQSSPIATPEALREQARNVAQQLNLPDPALQGPESEAGIPAVQRPEFWGGYRLWLAAIELWAEGADRFHDRIRYERSLEQIDAHHYRAGGWSHSRLQP
jgi:pyridoxamine 5'-phosphate oxidase